MWTIEYHPRAVEDLRSNIAPKDRSFVFDTIQKRLSEEPEKMGKALGGELSGYRRIRISKYRVIYQLKKDVVVVYVLSVDRREDVYREVFKRLGF